MKQILVTGKHGQLGYELQRSLLPLAEVVALGREGCDLSNEKALRTIIKQLKPDIIVNAAAYTAVDKAESEPDVAEAVNHLALKAIGEEAEKLSAVVIHYSTDYVYDGRKNRPYLEKDATNPQGIYGLTKLAGERALAKACHKHLIFRTSWVLGAYGNNFAKTILRLAATKEKISVVADQFGAPTTAALLADVTSHVVASILKDSAGLSAPYGVYHLAASGKTCWYEYAQFVVNLAHEKGKSLVLSTDNITAISTIEYPTPAIRPANSSLDTSKFQNAFDLQLPDWQIGVRHVLEQVLS
jgi:dTDP-4-dehydrorhamnose reductase